MQGDNGAGKTSLLRILTGLSQADEGEIYWTETAVDAHSHDYRANMHYVSHRSSLVPHLTVHETIDLLFPLLGATASSDIELLLEDVGLSRQLGQSVATLSAGQQQRLGLLRLLARNKPLWILDEPQSHLDLSGQAWLQKLLSDHVQNNGLLIVVSHSVAMNLPNLHNLVLENHAE